MITKIWNKIKNAFTTAQEAVENVEVKGRTPFNTVYKIKGRKSTLFIPKGSEYITGPTVKKTSTP